MNKKKTKRVKCFSCDFVFSGKYIPKMKLYKEMGDDGTYVVSKQCPLCFSLQYDDSSERKNMCYVGNYVIWHVRNSGYSL